MGILLVYDVTDRRSFDSMSTPLCDLSAKQNSSRCDDYGEHFGLVRAKTNRISIDIKTWFENVEQHATEGVSKILIGNKCDWTDKRVVDEKEGRELADQLGIPFLEVSAKNNFNIDKAFTDLAEEIKAKITADSKNEAGSSGGVNVGDRSDGSGSKCC